MGIRTLAAFATAVCLASTLAVACGGGGSTTAPSPNPNPNPNPGPSGRTITITASGVSPNQISVPAGSRITFVNNDSRPHDMTSDPHPEHTDCPEINQVGFLSVGQTKETGNLNTPRTCGFHDHNNPSSTSLQGRIIILAVSP